MSSDRISRHELFTEIARLFGQRSTCPRAQVGAIAVRDGRIVATGYVGAPAGAPHCLDVGCDERGGHCIRTVHAESNVVAYAARSGVSLRGTTLYTTHAPCLNCAKVIINSGISEVLFENEYHPHDADGSGDGVKLLRAWYSNVHVVGPNSKVYP